MIGVGNIIRVMSSTSCKINPHTFLTVLSTTQKEKNSKQSKKKKRKKYQVFIETVDEGDHYL